MASRQPDQDSVLRLPLLLVQAQLAKGAFKIPYAQLRQFSPAGIFPADPARESLAVEIPVSEILPRLKPDQLPRRSGQKKIEVPDDIGPIFGPDGGPAGLRLTEAKPRSAAPTTVPAAAKEAATTPPAPARQSAPVPPNVPIPAPAPAVPPTVAAQAAPPIRPAPEVLPPPPPPAPPKVPAQVPPVSEPIRAPQLDPSLASLQPKTPKVDTFPLALMDVAAFWTDQGRSELANLYRHSLEIPMSTLEAALKTGKLQFQWREVRQWVRLAPGNTLPTISDDLQVELPLAIVAPRFMEHRHPAKNRRKVEVNQEIPDLFAKKEVPPAEAVSTPVEAPAEPAKIATPLPAPEKSLNDYAGIFGEPGKKDWSLAEVAERTSKLAGVAGAVIATSDGLLIAGNWTGEVKTDSVAAFIPQMFSRMQQYTKELKLGDPGNFTLLIGNTPLQIFKTGGSYLSVLGRTGEELPAAELKAIASRLATTSTGK